MILGNSPRIWRRENKIPRPSTPETNWLNKLLGEARLAAGLCCVTPGVPVQSRVRAIKLLSSQTMNCCLSPLCAQLSRALWAKNPLSLFLPECQTAPFRKAFPASSHQTLRQLICHSVGAFTQSALRIHKWFLLQWAPPGGNETPHLS